MSKTITIETLRWVHAESQGAETDSCAQQKTLQVTAFSSAWISWSCYWWEMESALFTGSVAVKTTGNLWCLEPTGCTEDGKLSSDSSSREHNNLTLESVALRVRDLLLVYVCFYLLLKCWDLFSPTSPWSQNPALRNMATYLLFIS